MVDMPEIPDEDHDFTPDLARKIIGLYQTRIRALEAQLAKMVPTANCCVCGRIIDTREVSEGGDKFGCQIDDRRWVCSPECWDNIVDPDAALDAAPLAPERKFFLGDRVTKIKGSSWTGRVVGFYSTALTPVGYAVESENEPGSVQIYPEAALTAAQEGKPPAVYAKEGR